MVNKIYLKCVLAYETHSHFLQNITNATHNCQVEWTRHTLHAQPKHLHEPVIPPIFFLFTFPPPKKRLHISQKDVDSIALDKNKILASIFIYTA